MNRERAETYLRLVAEQELSRVATPPRDSAGAPPEAEHEALVGRQRSAVAAALYDLPGRQREVIALQYCGNLSAAETARAVGLSTGAVGAHTARGMATLQAALQAGTSRVAQVAQTLTAAGALDGAVADQVLAEVGLALGARRAGLAAQRGPDPRSLLRSPVARLPLGMLTSPRPPWASGPLATGAFTAPTAGVPGPAGTRAAPGHVIGLGQVIGVRGGGDVSGDMYLLSYAQTAAGARLTVVTRADGEFVPPGIEHSGMYRPAAVFPVRQFTARDDQGTWYTMDFSGRRGRRATELAGKITLYPEPPPGIRWLELITGPGEPAARIDLSLGNGSADQVVVTVSEAAASPGEHLLNQLATRLLLLALAFPREIRLHPAVPAPEPFSCVVDGLGDAIAALQACGALSPLSPVPGQLAALCANLNISGHGITAPPAAELPGPWLSVLAHYRHRKPGPHEARDGCAAAGVAFPELDGIALTLLGLHNADGSTFLYADASGMPRAWPHQPPGAELDFPLRIWVRDGGGQWHATRAAARGWSAADDSGMSLRLEVVPPLTPATTWIEVLAAGPSVQASATLPLRWH